MEENIISIKDFSISFGKKKIIDNLNFEVKQGEVFGFLGSNGSGKTTTIRSLLGIYIPDSGELLVDGKKFTPENSNLIGYLPEERGLYKKEKVIDVMTYFGQLKGLSRKDSLAFAKEFLKRVGLEDKENLKVEKLSGGQQQKIQLGITIIGNPKLLILDEPTKGFDPVNRELLMEIIREQNKKGATIIMVTHDMSEVERICNRAILLKDGKKYAYGTIDEIRNEFGQERILIEFSGKLPESNKFKLIKKDTNYAEVKPISSTQEILIELANSKDLTISKFDVQKSTMNEIFLSVYGDENNMEVKNV